MLRREEERHEKIRLALCAGPHRCNLDVRGVEGCDACGCATIQLEERTPQLGRPREQSQFFADLLVVRAHFVFGIKRQQVAVEGIDAVKAPEGGRRALRIEGVCRMMNASAVAVAPGHIQSDRNAHTRYELATSADSISSRSKNFVTVRLCLPFRPRALLHGITSGWTARACVSRE